MKTTHIHTPANSFKKLIMKAGFSTPGEVRKHSVKVKKPIGLATLYRMQEGKKNSHQSTIEVFTEVLQTQNPAITKEEVMQVVNPLVPKLPQLPNRFDPDYLKDRLFERYGRHVPFMAIQYGSTVTASREIPNDLDYVVLVHGNVCHDSKVKRQGLGHVEKTSEYQPKAFDIKVIEFDSFWAGIMKGDPFEISVAKDGEVRLVEGMPRVYWDWLKRLANNILVDVEYLYNELKMEVNTYHEEYANYDTQDDPYNAIIIAYNQACNLIKMRVLHSFAPVTQGHTLYDLSKVGTLVKCISSSEGRDLFGQLVDFLKRKREVSGWFEFEPEFSKLLTILRDEELQALREKEARNESKG
jgi:hypothetical protein